RAALLGLDQLVDAVLPRAVGHHPTGVLVDDLDLVVLHHVVLVADEQPERAQCLGDQLLPPPLSVPQAAEPLAELLEPALPRGRELDQPPALLDDEVTLGLERGGEPERRLVGTALQLVAAAPAGDDER